jgi:hypothetical protein
MPLPTPVLTRRAAIASGAALLLGAIARPAVAQVATPGATPTGASDAVQLLNASAAAMTKLKTFAFDLVTTKGETTILEGFTLEEITGAVRRPTDFQTTVSVAIPFASLDLTAVSVNNQVWIELPAIGDTGGGWTSLGSSEGLLSLLNPDVLILQSVRYIDNAEIDRTGDIDGIDVTWVAGTVDFHGIATRLGGQQQDLSDQIAEGPVTVALAVDGDKLIRRIEITGPILATESEDVVREVTFSKFNEPVEIEQPDVSS